MSIKTAWEFAADILDPPDAKWKPQSHQLPPAGLWFGWTFLGGRGTGKTATDAKYVHDHVMGPPCDPNLPGGHWIGIIAPTKDDAVTSCVEGPAGLRQHCPDLKLRVAPGGTIVKWPNGATAKLFGAHTPDDVERLRSGGNRCLYWFEELAAWRYITDCVNHARYGLRLGPRPHYIASTTPKSHLYIRYIVLKAKIDTGAELTESEKTKFIDICRLLELPPYLEQATERERIVITRGTTDDNQKLPGHVKNMLYRDYSGTRLGRQELYAEVLEDIEGALWEQITIDQWRLPVAETPRHFDRIVVGIDPNAKAAGDEAGIIVMGKIDKWQGSYFGKLLQAADHPHGFVLQDATVSGGPEKWAKAAIRAFDDWGANLCVAEINNGGDMVMHTLHTYRPSLPVKVVHATRGKAKRAEPVSTLYQQGRMHHVGNFARLEDQMTTWDADDPPDDWSPDRMDGMVWAATELLIGRTQATSSQAHDNRLLNRR